AGTEHGVYVSFNAGDNWQPLQMNLPDTPVRDLVVKDNDVVLGTHGRGFWVLDDINPLRELNAETAGQPAVFFRPGDVYRGLNNAVFQYYLAQQADSVTIEVLDGTGKLIEKFTGTQSSYKQDPKVEYWDRKPFPPVTAMGLNVFSWYPAYPGAVSFDGMILWSANAKVGPKAPPGNYQVRFTAGAYTRTWPFQVKMDSKYRGVTEADLRETFDLAMKIRDQESRNNAAVIRIRALRGQLKERMNASSDVALTKAGQELLDKLAVIEEALYQVRNRSGQDPLNFPIKLGNRLSALRRSLETGDAKPTAGAYQVFAELSKELEGHLAALDQSVSAGLAAVNGRLSALGMKEIKL
ncbi:MAG: glycosyl hydrolase, partial [Bacteroidota bacterium]